MILGNGGDQNCLRVTKLFSNIYGNTSGAVLHACPASIVILGDHTHYNDGILLSVCVDKYWTFMVKKRKDKLVNILSTESENIFTIHLDELDNSNENSFKLLFGLIKILKTENLLKFGFDCVVSSTVPECLGLGSKAAQQVGFLNSLRKLFAFPIDDEKLLSFVRKNELNEIGKISNIAHHYTVQFGKEKKLFAMDLRSKEYRSYSIDRDDYSLVICDSGERIISPENICNERIEECEIGVKGLRLYIWGIKNLRDVELDFLHRHFHMLPKKVFSRVLYNVKERNRAEEAIKLIRKKDYREIGKIISESNKNLFEDYELENEHSRYLIREAAHLEGVAGAKMISCTPIVSTFNLVADDKIDKFIPEIKNSFDKQFQRQLKTYVVKLTGGVKKISLKEIEFSLQ